MEPLERVLGQLAVALRLVSDAPPLIAALERFPALYQKAVIRRFLWRLGVASRGEELDRQLVEAAERTMSREKFAIDQFFYRYRHGKANAGDAPGEYEAAFAALLRDYAPVEGNRHAYWSKGAVCSMLIHEVEDIWQAISEKDDWEPLQRKIHAIREMGQAHMASEF